MAAIVARRRRSVTKLSASIEGFTRNEKLSLTSQFHQTVIVGVLSAGKAWQQRRLAYTSEWIAFTHIGEDEVLDKIYLHEVMAVDRVSQPTTKGSTTSLASLDTVVDFSLAFQIRTIIDGHNCGRKYFLQAESETACLDLVPTLQGLVRAAIHRSKSPGQRRQELIRKIYNSNMFQSFAAILIILNFFASITEAQMQGTLTNVDGTPTITMQLLEKLNLILTIVFTVELVINMYAHWLVDFFKNGWAVFDFIVVTLSLITLGPLDLPISVLRALRVLRLFGRFKALKKILAALSASIIPMFNAFFIMLIVSMIYAIMGVTFFSDVAPDDFATFDRAFFALFRLSAGDTWLDSLQRVKEDGTLNYGPNLFIFSYIVIVVWILLQVSVAVLLDNFVSYTIGEEEQVKLQQKLEGKSSCENTNPLEPLLQRLMKGFVDDLDLTLKIKNVYQALDENGDGKLSAGEFCARLNTLDSRIHISEADFQAITQNLALCNSEGEVGIKEFERIMRSQLRSYIQTRLTDFTDNRTDEDIEFNNICSMKLVLSEVLKLARDQQEMRQGIQQILQHLGCAELHSTNCVSINGDEHEYSSSGITKCSTLSETAPLDHKQQDTGQGCCNVPDLTSIAAAQPATAIAVPILNSFLARTSNGIPARQRQQVPSKITERPMQGQLSATLGLLTEKKVDNLMEEKFSLLTCHKSQCSEDTVSLQPSAASTIQRHQNGPSIKCWLPSAESHLPSGECNGAPSAATAIKCSGGHSSGDLGRERALHRDSDIHSPYSATVTSSERRRPMSPQSHSPGTNWMPMEESGNGRWSMSVPVPDWFVEAFGTGTLCTRAAAGRDNDARQVGSRTNGAHGS